MNLAYFYPTIFWNCANLIVNSGGSGDEEAGTDYGKVSTAINKMRGLGINISLIDINKSELTFAPDAEKNQIYFGLKALGGINNETVKQIIEGRPYKNIIDFINRCPLNKTQMISLIKAGAFDETEMNWGNELNVHPRAVAMVYYLYKASEPKTKLNLQNFNTLLQRNLVPASLEFERRVFEFNKYLKTNTKKGEYFIFNDICNSFYNKHFDIDKLEVINGLTCIKQKIWDTIYQKHMEKARNWLKEEQNQILCELNKQLFMDMWNKYAQGSLSAWEMEALCFYYHEHELAHVDKNKYGISNFFKLPVEPLAERYFKRNGKEIPIWKTYKIIGTVIAKNDAKSMLTLLTPEGVVSVKFTKEYYANFKRQISEKQDDGTKKVLEKGWFKRGTMLMLTGYRRDNQFVTKTYSHTATHQLYKIDLENNGADMILTHERIDNED